MEYCESIRRSAAGGSKLWVPCGRLKDRAIAYQVLFDNSRRSVAIYNPLEDKALNSDEVVGSMEEAIRRGVGVSLIATEGGLEGSFPEKLIDLSRDYLNSEVLIFPGKTSEGDGILSFSVFDGKNVKLATREGGINWAGIRLNDPTNGKKMIDIFEEIKGKSSKPSVVA
jgi:hypothetical protein